LQEEGDAMTVSLIAGACLFFIGFYGICTRRNFLLILVCLELMLNGVNITLMTFTRLHAGSSSEALMASASAHFLVMLVYAVAACEAAVGLSILVSLFRQYKSLDVDNLIISTRYEL
jgi:NADH-quinone oxidoreductase subunit K